MYKSLSILAIILSLSLGYVFEEREQQDYDYGDDDELARQRLADPYLDGLLERYKQVRDSIKHSDEEERISKRGFDDVNKRVNVRMPGVSPHKHDSYFCVSKRMPVDVNSFIVAYNPIAEMHTAHHMLLFGCEQPRHEDGKVWNCGEMEGVCGSGRQRIMYAWGRNAPPLNLPKGVGFHVGKDATVKSLALQVHYGNVQQFKNGKKDYSGVELELTRQNLPYHGGIYLLADGWSSIPAHMRKWHIDTGCLYTDNPTLKPFAFRVHAHKLGKVVTGFRVRDNKWTLIGKGNPQKPQAFYESFNVPIETGDKLVARCTYDSTKKDTITHIGATMNDEMCNFYIMYYYDARKYPRSPEESCGLREMLDGSQLFNHFPPGSDVLSDESYHARNEIPEDLVKDEVTSVEYQEVQDWPYWGGNTPPVVGQIAGVAVNKDGMVVIFHRGTNRWGQGTFDENNVINPNYSPILANTLLFLSPATGEINEKLSWGGNKFYLPHGLTVDHGGNYWLTDVGLHQVFKYGPTFGDPKLVLGEAKKPGKDHLHFCKPTDVAVDRSGEFYVADGYCNSRVLLFSPSGRLMREINPHKYKDFPGPPLDFAIPHSLALDEDRQILYIADRENNRVVIFDPRGNKFRGSISKQFGGPVYAISYAKGQILHAVTADSLKHGPLGFCIDLHNKEVISTWKSKEDFSRPHDLTVTKDNKDIYVVQIGPNVIRKFRRK